LTAKDRAKGSAETGAERAPGFEESLQRLEAIVKTLEEGELPLEETLRLFEEGQALLKSCGEQLGRVELRVQELLRRADGEPALRERSDLGAEALGEGRGEDRGETSEDAGR
jgi:exodeoxyribonuclease VII small subunit